MMQSWLIHFVREIISLGNVVRQYIHAFVQCRFITHLGSLECTKEARSALGYI